jgi:glycosyltransferase involved in cell wall biosynthesis
MHLAFIDIEYGYDAARPDSDQPLGGTTSAVCFTARELTKAGIACTLFNRIEAPVEAHGIQSLPIAALADRLNEFSVLIFCGRWIAAMVRLVRGRTKAPLIAWMHESAFTPPLVPALDEFDGAVFVSEWQKRVNQPHARPHWRQGVIRNAMNPLVAQSFPPGEAILSAKAAPPVLLYAGGFARGAFHLPPLLERIGKREKDFTAEIYCNTNPSGQAEADAAYIAQLRALPHVAHVGMVSQTVLSAKMRRAAFLIAPNPWPETSCITLIEALASGMTAITTNRAALPESAAGFARHIAVDHAEDPVRFDMPLPYDDFAAALLAAMRDQRANPAYAEQRLRRQVDWFQEHYQWSQRVQEWRDFMKFFSRN